MYVQPIFAKSDGFFHIFYLSLNWLSQEFMEFTPGILRAFVYLGCGERAGLQWQGFLSDEGRTYKPETVFQRLVNDKAYVEYIPF